jgi:hypothetical protein
LPPGTTSVKEFGAVGDGVTDDRAAIQTAFQLGKAIYFPEGTYLLKSKTQNNAFLLIDETNAPSKITFGQGAKLQLASDAPRDYPKPATLFILARKGNIKPIEIDGLCIDGSLSKNNIQAQGISAYELTGFNIEKLTLKNCTIENVGGTGIHTQALANEFSNIRTTNCGKHGIGIVNTTNHGQLHYFYLDGHTSTDDGAYAIDFSGLPDKNNPKQARVVDQWEGEVKNVTAIRPRYGIKTAGYWNLQLKNIRIEESGNNGFFLSKDAPGKQITVENMRITDAANNGLSLSGESGFQGKNISVIGCKVGLLIKRTNVVIDSLLIDGKHQNLAGIRMGSSDVTLRNFTVMNNAATDPYPVWVNGKNIVLENGIFLDNESPYEVIIKEQAGEVRLENLQFISNSTTKRAAIRTVQTKGTTTLLKGDFSQFRGKSVAGKGKKIEIVAPSKIKKQ